MHNILLSPSKGERGGGLFLILLFYCLTAVAQPGTWDREKYPDLPSPTPTVNMKAARKMMKRLDASKASGKVRPDHLNNALQPSFPPIINQSGGSCGAASSIYYQFTNQINTARFTAADSDERRYATHFPWLIANNSPSGTGYDRLGKDVGIASCATYDGTRRHSQLRHLRRHHLQPHVRLLWSGRRRPRLRLDARLRPLVCRHAQPHTQRQQLPDALRHARGT